VAHALPNQSGATVARSSPASSMDDASISTICPGIGMSVNT
jgi:hypothetical protein